MSMALGGQWFRQFDRRHLGPHDRDRAGNLVDRFTAYFQGDQEGGDLRTGHVA
jgi:hypothetical protein